MPTYTDVFGGSTVQPSDVQFASVALTASITTDWPQFATTTQPMARIMKVAATVGSLTITLPDATLVGAGQDVLFDNSGAQTFTVLDHAGGTVATLTAGQVKYLYLSDNATAAGVWRVTVFGVGSSTLDASQLAGYGLKATSATISAAPLVTGISSNTTVVAADRAKVFVWTGVSGTLTLPSTSGSTADFAIEVRNQGTGTLTIAPVGGVLIDSALSITLSVNESCFVHMGATDWYTVGRGRNTNFNFTQLAKAVTGGTTALTLTESSNVVQTYTGVLLSNQTITLPAVVQVYYVRNNTTGAYTFTFACAAGGSTVTVAAAQAAILFCDGTNIINANTSLAGGITALLFAAGSASTPSIGISTPDNGFYSSGTDEIAVTINGTYVGKWTSAGYQGNVALALASNGLNNLTTTVTTTAAAAPSAGQVLTASSSTLASWVTPISLAGTNTWTGAQTFTNSLLKLLGSSTGVTTFASANASATDYTITFPAATGTLADLASAQTLSSKTLVAPVLGTPISGNLTSCTADGTNAVGYKIVPQITKVADGAPTTGADLTYSGKHIYHTSTAGTFTIPANSSIAYPIGTALTFTNGFGAGVLNIAITTDTMYWAPSGTTGARVLAASGIATALKVDSTVWVISGSGLT